MAARKLNFKKIGVKAAGLGAGAVAARVLTKKVAANLNPKLKSAGVIVAGAMLPSFMGRSQFLSDMGDGMMSVGASELIGNFVPGLAGIGELDDFDDSIGTEDAYMDDLDEDPDDAIGDPS